MKPRVIFTACFFLTSCTGATNAPTVDFEAPRPVLADRTHDSSGPQMFFTPSGHLYLLAGVKHGRKTGLDLFISKSGGDTFDETVHVASPSYDAMTMGEMSPVLVEDPAGPSMDVLFQGANGKLYFDRTKLFSHKFPTPVDVVKKSEPSENGFATMALSPKGVLYVAWLDGRASDRNPPNTFSIYVARSLNHGKTFETPVKVDGSTCPCCRPAFAFGADGTVYVAWRKDYPGNFRDIVVASSQNGGTFSEPVRVAQDGWSLEGCPDSGPSMTVNDGHLYVAWYTQGSKNIPQIEVAHTDDMKTFSQPSVISSDVLDANHPRFVAGATVPMLVFQGRSPSAGQWSPVTAFIATIGPEGASKPVALQNASGSLTDPIAIMRDAQSMYLGADAEGGEGTQVVISRGRLQ